MLAPGTRLGNYRISHKLGSGGMAEVYEAVDCRLDRHVALKVLPPAFAHDAERAERFRRETLHSASIEHPNIVRIYDVGHEGDTSFYAMALLTGGDLRERIRGGMPLTPALSIVRQVAQGLAAAHAAGFVHRDVKPENVMFDAQGTAVLTDLGIARSMSSEVSVTEVGMSIGTPHYMSPEQARGEAVDGRSDLYSLGIMFYEMLTGSVPYDAEDSYAVSYMHVNEAPPRLPDQWRACQGILDRLTAKRPDGRFRSASELVAAIDRFVQGERVPAGSPKAMAGAGRRRGNRLVGMVRSMHPALAALVGVSAAVTMVALGMWILNPNPRSTFGPSGGSGGGMAPLGPPRQDPERRAEAPETPSFERPVPASQVSAEKGTIIIETVQTGVLVEVDGRPLGSTPLKPLKLDDGKHVVRLSKQGYLPFEQEIEIGSGEFGLLQKSLEVDVSGTLTLNLRPPDAKVMFSDHPRLVYSAGMRVEPDHYIIKVSSPGYKTKTLLVEIEDSATVALDCHLQRMGGA